MAKDRIQKWVYLSALLVYIVSWVLNSNYHNFYSISSFGIAYWAIDLIVTIPLLFQVLFNNKFGWIVILFLLVIHLSFSIREAFSIPDNSSAILPLILFYLLSFGLMIFLYPLEQKGND